MRAGLVGLHGLAAGALLYSELASMLRVVGSLLLLLSLIRQLYRYATARSPGFVTRLGVCSDGRWELTYGDGTVRQLRLGRYYVHAWLLILQFHGRLPAQNPALTIPADATDAESLRRLRQYLLRLDRSAES